MCNRSSRCWLAFLIVLSGISSASAQDAAPVSTGGDATAKLPAVEIQKLVAPIALYPDVLVAQILPASTFPMDVVQAARWLRKKPDMTKLLEQPWDPCVLSLCHYPDVIYKLDEDLDWTSSLGAAFLDQQEDVMQAIQDLRAKAKASGVLQTTKEQTVVVESNTIVIAPSQPQVVYVPQYNPQVIYVDNDDDDDVAVAAVSGAAIGFAAGMAMGAWLDNDCDWHGYGVAYCRPGYWHGYAGIHGPTRVAWGNDWAAAVGPRRAAVVGENGGAYVGPRGAAVWGENGHGAAWRRGGAAARPYYSNNYAGYGVRTNSVASANRNQAFSNNRQTNITQNNVNIDRGDRNSVRGGDRTNVGGDRNTVNTGNRANVSGGDRTNAAVGDRANAGAGNRANAATPERGRAGEANRANTAGRTNPSGNRSPGASNSSAFSRPSNTMDANRAANRGTASRQSSASSSANRQPSQQARPSSSRPPQRSSSAQRPSSGGGNSSAFRSSGSSGASRQASSRGSASRGGGGGGRGGGGRR